VAPEPRSESWFRRLEDGRLEVFLLVKDRPGVPDIKVRATGPEEAIYEVTAWFEQATGLTVSGDWKRPTKRVDPAQLDIMSQLPSHHATVPTHGEL
jgi:hypothetical protein